MGAADEKRGSAAGGGRGGAGDGGAFAGEGGGVGDGAYGSGFHLEKVSPDERGELPNYKDFNRTAKGCVTFVCLLPHYTSNSDGFMKA